MKKLETSKILFITSYIINFIASAGLLVAGVGGLIMVPMEGLLKPGWIIAIILGAFMAVIGALKVWCSRLVRERRKLTTAGILGIVFGVVPGDIISLIAGILVIVAKDKKRRKNPNES